MKFPSKIPTNRATPQPLRRQHRVGLRHQRRRLGRLAPAAAAADPGDAQTSGDRGRQRLKGKKGWEKVENRGKTVLKTFGVVKLCDLGMSFGCQDFVKMPCPTKKLRVLCVKMCKLIVKRLHYARELTKD